MLRVVVPYDLVLALTQSHTSMLGRCLLNWGGWRSSRAWLARARISPVQGESSGRGRTALVSWSSAAPAAAHTFGSWSKGTECEIGASAGARRRRSARACLPSSGVWGRTNLCQTEKNLVVFIRARALLQLSWQKAALSFLLRSPSTSQSPGYSQPGTLPDAVIAVEKQLVTGAAGDAQANICARHTEPSAWHTLSLPEEERGRRVLPSAELNHRNLYGVYF